MSSKFKLLGLLSTARRYNQLILASIKAPQPLHHLYISIEFHIFLRSKQFPIFEMTKRFGDKSSHNKMGPQKYNWVCGYITIQFQQLGHSNAFWATTGSGKYSNLGPVADLRLRQTGSRTKFYKTSTIFAGANLSRHGCHLTVIFGVYYLSICF